MDTQDLLAFTEAASAGSLSQAARRLGLAPIAVSRSLAALEAELGARLMHRTTRSLSLTAEGSAFLPFAQAIVENAEQAQARLRTNDSGAAGLLRVSVPVAFGRKIIAPLLPALLADNPALRISLDMNDALPDLVATGTDLAIRIARLRDSGLIAQKLADNPRLLVAAPAYVAARGKPRLAADLEKHDCVPLTGLTHWTLRDETGERAVRINPRLTASSIEGCHAASLAGCGIALLSEWNVRDDLATGALMRIDLDDAKPDLLAISAVYPSARLVLPKVRVFITALRKALSSAGIGTGEAVSISPPPAGSASHGQDADPAG